MNPAVSPVFRPAARGLTRLVLVATLALASAISVGAWMPPPDAPVVGITYLHLNVANLDQSVGFYRDVLGMDLFESLPRRPGEFLGAEPGATLRSVRLRVPGGDFAMELVEWSGIPLRPNQPRFQDPG